MKIFHVTSRFRLRRRKGKKKAVHFESGVTDAFRIQQLLAQIFSLEQNLQKSTRTVESLKAQLAEYDVLLAHAQCRIDTSHAHAPAAFQLEAEERSSPQPRPSEPASPLCSTTRVWIDDLWLCNDTENTPIQEAEAYWKNGSPQSALEVVSQAIDSNPFLSPVEELRCRIFAAAVLHSMGRIEVSSRRLGVIMETTSRYSRVNDTRCKDLIGIAHYILGRNLMENGEFCEAYYELSRSLGTPGYHQKAREYQKIAVVEFTRKSAMADVASISSSLRPVVSRDELKSTSTNDVSS